MTKEEQLIERDNFAKELMSVFKKYGINGFEPSCMWVKIINKTKWNKIKYTLSKTTEKLFDKYNISID